jgi:predicted glycosyltransferase
VVGVSRAAGVPPRVLFSVPGKRGLGHVMRGLNVAREIQALEPAAECVFVSRGGAIRSMVGDEFGVVVVGPEDERLPAVVGAERLKPHVIVHDTALPDDVRIGDAAPVYVMRRSLPHRQREVMDSPALRDVALIVVPHTRHEFGYDVPADLAERCRFVGPIARRPTSAGVVRARERYDAQGHFLVTSTVGGGGFQEQAEAFLAAAAAVQVELVGWRPDVRHVVVRGPNFTGTAAAVPGAREVTFDPELVELLAASDLVVAEGGYNTVLEVRLAQVPGVFLPSVRSWDDQEGRVRELERKGLARVLIEPSPSEAASVVAGLASDPQWLAAVRGRYALEHLDTGNRKAAEAVLDLAARTSGTVGR